MKFSSFRVFKMVLEDANKRFAPAFTPVQERIDILEQYCSALDRIIEDYDGEEFECEVDEISMAVKLSVVLSQIVSDNLNSLFQALIERAVYADVVIVDSDHLRLTFVFPSLWEKA